jgi:drug/metabolite transporter (DMT)-like permease
MRESHNMTLYQALRLIFIAAIWGASHVLVKIAVPELGPVFTAFLRMLIGASTLTLFQVLRGTPFLLRKNWKIYLMVGLFYVTIPITLFALASVLLPSAYLVILNATTPLFTAIFSAWILLDAFTRRKLVSLMLGLSGVALLAEFGVLENTRDAVFAMAMGLTASASYGLCGVLIKRFGNGGNPTALVTMSNWIGAILLMPWALYSMPVFSSLSFSHHSLSAVMVSVGILGALGSGFAFVVFYQLISEIGPFRASLSTFLMPFFGLIWGMLFLSEQITAGMGVGAALVISSTALFMSPKSAAGSESASNTTRK